MKHIKNYYVALAMTGVVLCGGLTSCSDDDDIDTEVVNGTQEALDAASGRLRVPTGKNLRLSSLVPPMNIPSIHILIHGL